MCAGPYVSRSVFFNWERQQLLLLMHQVAAFNNLLSRTDNGFITMEENRAAGFSRRLSTIIT